MAAQSLTSINKSNRYSFAKTSSSSSSSASNPMAAGTTVATNQTITSTGSSSSSTLSIQSNSNPATVAAQGQSSNGQQQMFVQSAPNQTQQSILNSIHDHQTSHRFAPPSSFNSPSSSSMINSSPGNAGAAAVAPSPTQFYYDQNFKLQSTASDFYNKPGNQSHSSLIIDSSSPYPVVTRLGSSKQSKNSNANHRNSTAFS